MNDNEIKEIASIIDNVKARIPGLSSELPTQYSWLTGEARTYSDYSTLWPFPYRDDGRADPITNELMGLESILSGPDRKINGVTLTPEQYSEYTRLHGNIMIAGETLLEALRSEVSSGNYKSWETEEERIRALRKIISRYRDAAKKEIVNMYPELRVVDPVKSVSRKAMNNPIPSMGVPAPTLNLPSNDLGKLTAFGV